MAEFKDRLKELRKERGLTQKQLGELCKPMMLDVAIRKYELGLLYPKVKTISRIATALNVSIAEIMDWSEFDERVPKQKELSDYSTDELMQEVLRRCSNGS